MQPYSYANQNPVRYIDPDGQKSETTIVSPNEDGTYKVENWIDDGRTNVVTEDGEKIGQSLTTHSFVSDDGKAVEGAIIDLNDNSGQEFFDNEIRSVGLNDYRKNATGGKHYDFKRKGTKPGDANYNNPKYHYRGMTFQGKIASARDVGNYSAGFVAGSHGLGWGVSRKIFDAVETQQKYNTWNPLKWRSFEIEGQPTQKAERQGYNKGHHNYEQRQIERKWQNIKNYPIPVGMPTY